MNVLHISNRFDPAGDVVRCVDELKKHSRHRHELVVKDVHEFQGVYQFKQPWITQHNVEPDLVYHLFDWADVVLYQFVGYEWGWHDLRKPSAFRNINIYWNAETDHFWSLPFYNAQDLTPYKLLSSSHVGAADFLGSERFRWLPDLIPIHDALYSPDWGERPPCVSYIKHAAEMAQYSYFGCGAAKQNLHATPHPVVLWKRKTQAKVAIDNVCDGHFGLSGCELMSLAIPCVVFNHPKTRAALAEMCGDDYPPFIEVGPSVEEAVRAVERVLALPTDEYMALRRKIRAWTEKWWDSKFLIERWWDPFVEELAVAA